ncbi:MAG: CADD family putative folate metabolism protein [Rhizobacter sp.]|nr:CADD family putative folate metabolism protein [Chlorobiales bacterium]
MTLSEKLSFSEKLQAVVSNKHLLKHPFYTAWTEGRLTQTHLARYAEQYFHHVLAEPTYLSAIHFNTPSFNGDLSVRQEILANLIGEEFGEKNHPALWKTFAKAVGATDESLTGSEPLPQTANLVSTFRNLCLNSPFYAGLAAMYAYESQIPEIAATKTDGLKKFYGLTDDASVEFFTVHEQADKHHSRTELELVMRFADTPQKESEVLAAAEAAADALWLFLDGVYETYCTDIIAARASVSLN